jgi:tetratricopeptide (TPR) repeat protein
VNDLVCGSQLLRNGKIDEAILAFQKAIAYNPNFHWSYYKLGETLERLGNLEEAIVAYKKVISLNPNMYWAYYKLGEISYKLNCWEEAIGYFYQAISVQPNFIESNINSYRTYQKLGEILSILDRKDEASNAFYQAIAVNRTAGLSYFCLADVLAQQKKWGEAIKLYQQAISLDFKEPKVFWGLGKTLECLKRWDEAIVTYQKTIELDVNQYQSYQYLGNLLLIQRQWIEAVIAHQKALQLNPQSSSCQLDLGRALYYLGKSLERKNNYSDAIEQYRKALDLGFDRGPVHYHLGKDLSQLGFYEEAVVELKQALEFNPLFLDWRQELEYALNQLEIKLANERTNVWTTNVSCQHDIKALNQLITGSGLDSPKTNQSYYGFIRIAGWILPKNVDLASVRIIAKLADYEQEELLSFKRPDVITKRLNAEPKEHHQLFCGFDFKVESQEKIELYISIEDHKYYWLTIQADLVPYAVIASIQQTWHNYINNNLKDISDAEAKALQNIPSEAIERYIYGKPEVVERKNIGSAINYLDLSDIERSNLERLLDCTNSPEFGNELVESALKNGFCQIPDPWGESDAISKESFHIASLRVTVLRFVTPSGKTFLLVQWIKSGHFIYFPGIQLIVFNDYFINQYTPTIIRNLITKFSKNFDYTIKSESNRFGGIISSFDRPAHFYYDICWGLYLLNKRGLLNQIPYIYKYRDGNLFSISSLFHLDKPQEIEYKNLEVIGNKSYTDNEFYIHIGSNGHGYENLSDKEELSQMILSSASELVDEETINEVNLARECYPLLWFGVTGQKRAWVEQVEGGGKIITELSKIYPKIGVVFDGWTSPINPTQYDINETAKDQAIVDKIIALLLPSVKTFTIVGSTTVRKLAFATIIDICIANKGTGAIHINRFAKRPGVLHINNSVRLGVSSNIHYNVINVPSNQVKDIPNPQAWDVGHISYSINPDVILSLVKEMLVQSKS